jgi:hypothetical protein
MSKVSDIKDIGILAAVAVGGYFAYQFFKKGGAFQNAKADLGLSSPAAAIDRRLKTDSGSRPFDSSGSYARPEPGFYDQERAQDGSTVTYAVSESEAANLSPFERGLLARGTDISTIKKIADTRADVATALRKYTPVGWAITKLGW